MLKCPVLGAYPAELCDVDQTFELLKGTVIRLMDKILHDPKDPKLWELWYIPYYGSCRILSINRIVPCLDPVVEAVEKAAVHHQTPTVPDQVQAGKMASAMALGAGERLPKGSMYPYSRYLGLKVPI